MVSGCGAGDTRTKRANPDSGFRVVRLETHTKRMHRIQGFNKVECKTSSNPFRVNMVDLRTNATRSTQFRVKGYARILVVG